MSDDTIRAKLLEANKEYGIFSEEQIREKCWSFWDGCLTGTEVGRSKALPGTKVYDLMLKMLRSPEYTPAELTYIHENLSPEAWEKLGLVVPFEEYDIWCVGFPHDGVKRRVTSESDGYVRFTSENGHPGSRLKDGSGYSLTPPPPKKEEFKSYVAVWNAVHGQELRYVIGHDGVWAKTTHTSNGIKQVYNRKDLKPLATNPEEAYKMLGEVLGKEDMVERIKSNIEYTLKVLENGCGAYVDGKRNALQDKLDYIANLERESK
jgi:hypothetical protein